MIFVFGSNEAGIHGAGAAKFALQSRGAPLTPVFRGNFPMTNSEIRDAVFPNEESTEAAEGLLCTDPACPICTEEVEDV